MLGNGSTQRLSDCVFMLSRSGLIVSTVADFGTDTKVLGRLALHAAVPISAARANAVDYVSPVGGKKFLLCELLHRRMGRAELAVENYGGAFGPCLRLK